MWSDADWAGDPEDTKSTSGLLLELVNPNNGRRWLISWSVRRQGASSSSTAGAETVARCYAVKHEGLPTLFLLDALLAGVRSTMKLIGKVENTQAITAVHRGCSKKLKFLERTHTCSIGSVDEFIESGQLCVDYVPTLAHRRDGFTKCLNPPVRCLEARGIKFFIST